MQNHYLYPLMWFSCLKNLMKYLNTVIRKQQMSSDVISLTWGNTLCYLWKWESPTTEYSQNSVPKFHDTKNGVKADH